MYDNQNDTVTAAGYIEARHPDALREAMDYAAQVDGSTSQLLYALVNEIARLNVVVEMARSAPALFATFYE